jgi:hypothetical protein
VTVLVDPYKELNAVSKRVLDIASARKILLNMGAVSILRIRCMEFPPGRSPPSLDLAVLAAWPTGSEIGNNFQILKTG